MRQRGLNGLEKEHKLTGPVIDMTQASHSCSSHNLVNAEALSSSRKKSKEKKNKHKHKKRKKSSKVKRKNGSDSDSAGRKHHHRKKCKMELDRKEMATQKVALTTPSVKNEDVITVQYLGACCKGRINV